MSESSPGIDESPGTALLALRAASRRLDECSDDGAHGGDGPHGTDAAADAERFEGLHEALTAVLDDLDRA